MFKISKQFHADSERQQDCGKRKFLNHFLSLFPEKAIKNSKKILDVQL